MEKVIKKHIAIYRDKSDAVNVTNSAALLYPAFIYISMLGLVIIILSILTAITKTFNLGLLIAGIVLLSAPIITAIILNAIYKSQPSLILCDGKLLLKADKDFYLSVSADELQGYTWTTPVLSTGASHYCTSRHYCTYYGKVKIILDNATYTLSCSSLRRTKYLLDAFKENKDICRAAADFGKDYYRNLINRIYQYSLIDCIFFITGVITFAITDFWYVATISLAISVVIFCLMLVFVSKNKKLHKKIVNEQYDAFVMNADVKLHNVPWLRLNAKKTEVEEYYNKVFEKTDSQCKNTDDNNIAF